MSLPSKNSSPYFAGQVVHTPDPSALTWHASQGYNPQACSDPAAVARHTLAVPIQTSVRWEGPQACKVVAVSWKLGNSSQASTQVQDDSDDSDDDPNEQEDVIEYGVKATADNIGDIKPMQTLGVDHAHNINLVKQFDELASSFVAWRPVRGDGNCYYRALLFAWLERSLSDGQLRSIKAFSQLLRQHKTTPGIPVKQCRRLLKGWTQRRQACGKDRAQVKTLLENVETEFNRVRSDDTLIRCLRYLTGMYILQNKSSVLSVGITYEEWASALGAQSLDAYVQSLVMNMGEDAADLVQFACPHLLQTRVRIVMVERDSQKFAFVDYGHGALAPSRTPTGQSLISQGSLRPGTQTAISQQQLQSATSSDILANDADVFLLFQPGHYDILQPLSNDFNQNRGRRSHGRLDLIQDGPSPSVKASGNEKKDFNMDADVEKLKRRAEQRWKGMIKIMNELCGAFTGVLHCLEERLLEEFMAKRKRVGSCDEPLFEGQLDSVMDPLRKALGRFHCIPEDSPFTEEDPGAAKAASMVLLPSLMQFLQDARNKPEPPKPPEQEAPPPLPANGNGLQHPSHNIPNAGMRQGVMLSGYPREPQPIPPLGTSQVVDVNVEVSRPSNIAQGLTQQQQQHQQLLPQQWQQPPQQQNHLLQPRQQQPSQYVAQPQQNQQQQQQTLLSAVPESDKECAYCMAPGATMVASCGCAFHQHCLVDYVKMESATPADKICCHIHSNKPLGAAFIQQNVPGFTLPPKPPGTNLLRPSIGYGGSCQPCRPGTRVSMGFAPQTGKVLGTQLNLASLPPASSKRLPQTGNLGAALGVPCVLCYGEDGLMKTLHCSYKIHSACLKDYWWERVKTLHRVKDIRCPAESSTNCNEFLSESDLHGVLSAQDFAEAQNYISSVDTQNQELIEDLKRQSEAYRPTFECGICLVDHDVEGCCTLPCQHRFCFESLGYTFQVAVKERQLANLCCPDPQCRFDLRSEDHIHILKQCLDDDVWQKLLEFLTREDGHIYECRHPGCEERVWVEDRDDPADLHCNKGHRFCGKCECGPHRGLSCEAAAEKAEQERRNEEELGNRAEAFKNALASGWKPCPNRCQYGGGFKNDAECDHVTCQCGLEFCWDCGVTRGVALAHDNRWHKPSCRYFTKYEEVAEEPKWMKDCPECQKRGERKGPCPFPADDGYPESYIKKFPVKQAA